MWTITLNSNISGESLILRTSGVYNGQLDCALCLNALHGDGDHEHAVTLSAESVVLSAERMQNLADGVLEWLEMSRGGTTVFSGNYPLTVDRHSRCDLVFGDRPGTESPAGKPIATLKFGIGRISGEFSYVTDQSCLNLFQREIRKVLAGIVS